MAELSENNKTTIGELLTAKLRSFSVAFFAREKERLMIYAVAGVLLYIAYDFLRLTVKFSPTRDIIVLFLWLLAVSLFRLPGRATILAGIASLLAIPLSIIVQKPLLTEPSATLAFFLLFIGTAQVGVEAGRNPEPDDNNPLEKTL